MEVLNLLFFFASPFSRPSFFPFFQSADIVDLVAETERPSRKKVTTLKLTGVPSTFVDKEEGCKKLEAEIKKKLQNDMSIELEKERKKVRELKESQSKMKAEANLIRKEMTKLAKAHELSRQSPVVSLIFLARSPTLSIIILLFCALGSGTCPFQA